MAEVPLSPQERTLQVFCRIFAVVYALGALGFAVTPRLTFRLITLGRAPAGWTSQAVFWNVLACAMMTAIAYYISWSRRQDGRSVLPAGA